MVFLVEIFKKIDMLRCVNSLINKLRIASLKMYALGFIHRASHRGHVLFRFGSRYRGLTLRLLFCWLLGIFALITDEANQFDLRLNLRGPQKVNSDIVVIQLKQSDFSKIFDFRTNSIMNINEIADITDSFYWDKKIWSQMLSTLLSYNPHSILVTLFFGNNIGTDTFLPEDESLFHDSRVIWTTSMNNMERLSLPVMSRNDHSNVGAHEIRRDDDGVVRKLFITTDEVPNLLEKGLQKYLPPNTPSLSINFRGQNVFPVFTLSEILEDRSLRAYLRNKIIIIGAENSRATQYQTPLGSMSKAEITAHMADNLASNRWIRKLPFGVYALYVLLIVMFAIMLMNRYPQNVSLFLLVVLSFLLTAASTWSFDSFYIWLPALTPAFTLLMTWVVFVGHHATQIEEAHYRLQQEKKYLEELEQLKNNFVSLISHDLKTPIAKIQAVVNRLLTDSKKDFQEHPLEVDLKSLRNYSDELNRYIQSILKVLRVESRDFKLNKEVSDINEIIVDALLMLRPLAQEKGVHLDTQLEPLFSQEFDVTLIKEVVINLVENAIKYTPANGKIVISTQETQDHVVFKVNDTGEGIAKEDLVNIWGKFVRGKDQDMKSKGSGLGLYLVKYFIELHGGKVNLTSQLGKGTEVVFTLPLSSDESGA